MKQGTRLFAALVLSACFSVSSSWSSATTNVMPKETKMTNHFFAMDTGTRDAKHPTPESQAKMLKELGYAGIGYSGVNGIPEMLEDLDTNGLKMFTVYLGIDIDSRNYEVDPSWRRAMRELEGRDTVLWITLSSKRYKPSSTQGDQQAVDILRKLADPARESGLRIALYPHAGTWLERVEDAVRVTKKAARRNIGVTFNLCHWLKVDDQKNMQSVLKSAMPHLLLVTINGADSDGKNWDQLIQTLDRGSFDVRQLLKALNELGYTGPIGLQGYGIGGDVYENLKRSMEAWRRFSADSKPSTTIR